ncbi:unnamed protein product, partial [Rotaria sp. Silwood1]
MDDHSNRSNTNDLSENVNRQLSTYIDNASSASTNSRGENKSDILYVDTGNLMVLSNYTENDAVILDVLGLSKHYVLGVQIKGKLYDEVLIKLFDDKAPITC